MNNKLDINSSSLDILKKSNIGIWVIEFDNNQVPKMYGDDTLYRILGIEDKISPNEFYNLWYEQIDRDSILEVQKAIDNMKKGIRTEVRYLWHHKTKKIITLRLEGSLNNNYLSGIRIEGTISDVSDVEHSKKGELEKSKFHVSAIEYIVKNSPTIKEFIEFFLERIVEETKCDQAIFRDMEANHIIRSAPSVSNKMSDVCSKCPFFDITSQLYSDGYVIMNDCKEAYKGTYAAKDCPAKSLFSILIFVNKKLSGLLAIRFINSHHEFSDSDVVLLTGVSKVLGMMLERVNAINERDELEQDLKIINKLNNSMDWRIRFDNKGNITKIIWSDALLDILGYEADDSLLTSIDAWSKRIYIEDRGPTLDALKKAFNSRNKDAKYEAEYRFKLKDGKWKWYRGVGEFKYDKDGTPSEMIGVMIDIDAIKQQEMNLKVIDTLVYEYDSVFLVNLNTNNYLSYSTNVSSPFELTRDIKHGYDFSAIIDVITNKYIRQSDCERIKTMTSYEYIKENLAHCKSVSTIYRTSKDGKDFYCEMKIVKVEGKEEEPKNVVVAFANNNKEVLNQFVAESFAKRFVSIFTIDLESDKITVIKRPSTYIPKNQTKLGVSVYSARIIELAERVEPEYKETWLKLADYNYLQEIFAHDEIKEIVYRREGKWNNALLSVTERDSNGKVISFLMGFYALDKEMAEKQELELKLEEAVKKSRAASEAKTKFLFNMSHDIRTPMNAVLGFTNMAINNIDKKEKVKDSLDKIRSSGNLLLELINDILDMSRIESGKISLNEISFDIYNIFDSIRPLFESSAISKSIDIKMEVKDIKHRYVYLDPLRIDKILSNIISNAIKYTNEGGKITSYVYEIDDVIKEGYNTYRFQTTDTGIGISKEFIPHLFEEFSRENTSTVSGIQGSGLGLSLVKGLVTIMDGRIDVKSKQGVGSIFTIDIPLKPCNKKTYEKIEKKEKVNIDYNKFKGKKALIVEDNEMNREIAAEILLDVNISVVTAENGNDAVNLVKKYGPDYFDFILMDIQMPVMNGYDATKAIRELYPNKKIPIFALSANAFEEDKQRSKEVGMDAHIVKPINPDRLFEVIQQFIK